MGETQITASRARFLEATTKEEIINKEEEEEPTQNMDTVTDTKQRVYTPIVKQTVTLGALSWLPLITIHKSRKL